MKTPDHELRRLTDAWHDGTISPEDGLRLEKRLATDETARSYFFEIAAIEAAMAAAAAELPDQLPAPEIRSRGLWWKMAAVFVVGLFCGALALKSMPSKPSDALARKPPAAMVTGMLGVTWAGPPVEQSVAHAAGLVKSAIVSGLIELTFASGTRALVEGPAEFQVMGDNAIQLNHGKLVADVPKGAEGFSVTYPDGKIVDIGTEFGVEISDNGRSASFGVFRGEIEFHPKNNASQVIHLLENHAIRSENGNTVSVPFDQEKFTRKLPSREFAWKIAGSAATPTVLEYDVSHLIWKPGNYRAICKWMRGKDGLITEGAELLLDGHPVAQDEHSGFAGSFGATRGNSYELVVSSDAYRRGRWTLRIHGQIDRTAATDADSTGVVLFEEGLALHAEAGDFLGTWEYLHDGMMFHRTFKPDGSASLAIDGVPYRLFDTSRWHVSGGTLVLEVATGSGDWWQEHHLLRDSRTLVFVDRPYRNATRVDK
jgi:ferric-dicitrate binding protein FerR (iron transport regulator)